MSKATVLAIFDEVIFEEFTVWYQLDMNEGPQQLYWYSILTVKRTPVPGNNTMMQKKDILKVSDLFEDPKTCWTEGEKEYKMIVEEARGRRPGEVSH